MNSNKTRKKARLDQKDVTPELVREVKGELKRARNQDSDTFGQVIDGFDRSLTLGSFADAGRSPKMTDVEIAICFADLRGFTEYVHDLQRVGQDNRVQHFLRDYFKIYPTAVLRAIWALEPKSTRKASISALNHELRRLVIPTTYKNLGDGMMIVWELQEASSFVTQGAATRVIVEIVKFFQEHFKLKFGSLSAAEVDGYSQFASRLKLGFGLAKGHAWRLEFGHQAPYDYAGSIVNLAARLQGIARPEGIVAQVGFSESLFQEKVKEGEGRITQIPSPKGLGSEPIDVFLSNTIQLDNSGELPSKSRVKKQVTSGL